MTEAMASTGETERKKVWDLPTRLIKWALAGCVAAAWWMGENISFTNIGWHFWAGYAIGALVILRILWGFVGAPSSRFSALFGALGGLPGYAARLFRREPSDWNGHNPLGSLWLLGMLLALSVQVGTGLMAYNDSFFSGGPLADMVGERWSGWANGVHGANAKILLLMVVLHVSAVVFYAVWKKENLVRPMITGWKNVKRGRG